MAVDHSKRRQIMERSIRLGHCICDPRCPCPCDVFRNQGICPCAGERPKPADPSQIQMTTLTRNPGCASKISPADLEVLLQRLPSIKDPAIISGLASADDAAIYRLNADLSLVQTVDLFTPCVDDPRLFGRICAANCLSDIYAMGGNPRTALSILAFPSESLPGEMMFQMLSGSMEKFAEAGVALIGGHSIKDEEIKLGFAITGIINPDIAAGLENPQAGDLLILTKPLGTGVLSFAQQIGRPHCPGMEMASQSMATLNKSAADAMIKSGTSACTDVTGFGLFGHLIRLLRPHRLSARINAEALPAFEGVIGLLRSEVISGAIERNREYVADALVLENVVEQAYVDLGLDPQTSGGLLIAIPPESLRNLQENFSRNNVTGFIIGSIIESNQSKIFLGSAHQNLRIRVDSESNLSNSMSHSSPEAIEEVAHQPGCCEEIFDREVPNNSLAEAKRAFGSFMRSIHEGGILDEKTKELILFSLIVLSRCQPCFKTNYEKARRIGITQRELDEAAWCAIAMGGAPVKMFYQEATQSIQK